MVCSHGHRTSKASDTLVDFHENNDSLDAPSSKSVYNRKDKEREWKKDGRMIGVATIGKTKDKNDHWAKENNHGKNNLKNSQGFSQM